VSSLRHALQSARRHAAVCALLLGCGGSKVEARSAGEPARRCEVVIQAGRHTNSGKILHMMLRRVEAKSGPLAESYEETAKMIVAPSRDESVIAVRPLFPGQAAKLDVESTGDERVIAYFFFTNPGENWRIELPRPLPAQVTLELGQNQVDALEVER
jgi:hypothetical protein